MHAQAMTIKSEETSQAKSAKQYLAISQGVFSKFLISPPPLFLYGCHPGDIHLPRLHLPIYNNENQFVSYLMKCNSYSTDLKLSINKVNPTYFSIVMALLAAQQDGGAAHKTVLKHMHITVTSSQISPSRLKPFVLKSHWAGPG